MKFKVVKTPAVRGMDATWHFQCPFCHFSIWPDMLKNYVKEQTTMHLIGEHKILPGRVKLRVKKMKAAS